MVALCEMARAIALLDDDPAAALAAADESPRLARLWWVDLGVRLRPNYRAAALVRAGDLAGRSRRC